MKILIVDDSNIMLDRISKMIEETKEHDIVGLASNTQQGKEMLKKYKPDAVITDVRMPGGGGMELLTFAKEHYPKTSIIVITNYTYPQYKAKAYELGANYFLSKSDDLDELVKILDKITTDR